MASGNNGGYFAVLADLVSQDTLDQVERAMLDHTHRGVGNQDEATLLHGVRTLVELVRAEADQRAQARLDTEHESLRQHYQALAESERQKWDDVRTSLNDEVGREVRAFHFTWELLLPHRRKGSTYVRLADLAQTMGMSLDDWNDTPEPRQAGRVTSPVGEGGVL